MPLRGIRGYFPSARDRGTLNIAYVVQGKVRYAREARVTQYINEQHHRTRRTGVEPKSAFLEFPYSLMRNPPQGKSNEDFR
jgi:hypothetical protein